KLSEKDQTSLKEKFGGKTVRDGETRGQALGDAAEGTQRRKIRYALCQEEIRRCLLEPCKDLVGAGLCFVKGEAARKSTTPGDREKNAYFGKNRCREKGYGSK